MANNVLNLIRKDFIALWSEKTTGFLFAALLAISALFASYLTFSSLVFLLLVASTHTLNVFNLDEKFRTERFFASLPVRRRDIVLARYGELLAIAGAYFVMAYLANTASILAGKTEAQIPLGYCASVLVVLAFMSSFTYPFFFKRGLSKAKSVTTILLAIFMAPASTMIFMRPGDGSNQTAKAFLAAMNSPFPRDLLHTLLLIGIAILLWGVSIPVAVALYSRRDL